MRRPQRFTRGISLIEAVVALAVMAFGMLAYVGLQSSLRFNSDVAKQRSEAVRIAQQAIEEWRSYAQIEPVDVITDYADLATSGPTTISPADSNTVFTLNRTVTSAGTTPDAPPMKTLAAEVVWQDRNGDWQRVRLSTTIAASPPELAGTLSVPGLVGPSRQPLRRNPAIPLVAKDLGGGISGFKPPGSGSTTVWVFNNATGVIAGVCNSVSTGQSALTATDVHSCSDNANGLPLSGFVRFATGSAQPTAADAENPTSMALNLAVQLTLTSSGHASPDHACFADAPLSALTTSTVVPYFCAVFFTTGTPPLWSGMSTLTPLAFAEPVGSVAWVIAADALDAASTHYRVCRYTPATSDAESIPNQLHPRNYQNVNALEPLTNQNFLIIRAGDDLTPFQCPIDVPADPAAGDLVNSNTLLHQPAPAAP
jgi:Tfp pilus assembly protein PilV